MGEIDKIKIALAVLPAGEAVIIGHTDTVGADDSNDQLSLNRANITKALLIQAGFDTQQIITSGRGEREPLVETHDEVSEQKIVG